MTKTVFAFSLLLALATGCATNSVTNLTPTEMPRSANHMYRVEYQWESTQQTMRPETIKPYVLVGFDQIPMKRVMNNLWEGWIQVPPGANEVTYRFKVDYEYTGYGKLKPASKLSRDYKLIVK